MVDRVFIRALSIHRSDNEEEEDANRNSNTNGNDLRDVFAETNNGEQRTEDKGAASEYDPADPLLSSFPKIPDEEPGVFEDIADKVSEIKGMTSEILSMMREIERKKAELPFQPAVDQAYEHVLNLFKEHGHLRFFYWPKYGRYSDQPNMDQELEWDTKSLQISTVLINILATVKNIRPEEFQELVHDVHLVWYEHQTFKPIYYHETQHVYFSPIMIRGFSNEDEAIRACKGARKDRTFPGLSEEFFKDLEQGVFCIDYIMHEVNPRCEDNIYDGMRWYFSIRSALIIRNRNDMSLMEERTYATITIAQTHEGEVYESNRPGCDDNGQWWRNRLCKLMHLREKKIHDLKQCTIRRLRHAELSKRNQYD